MPSRQNRAVVLLLILLLAAGYGVIRTGSGPARRRETHETIADAPRVDQSAFLAAQQLVRWPTTVDELSFAEDALRISDQEMDLAFADAVREAAARPPALSREAKAVAERLQRSEKELAADQAEAASLAALVAKAGPTTVDQLTDELNLAKAHVALHQDEVDDAHRDLITTGGDPSGRMKAMLAEHEASSKSSDSTRVRVTAPPDRSGLMYRAQSWWQLQDKHLALAAARQMAESSAAVFSAQHEAAEAKGAGGTPDSGETEARSADLSAEARVALLRATDKRANENRARSALDQHVDNQRVLAGVYAKWLAVIESQQRSDVNRALKSVTLILGILLAGLLLDRWIEHLLGTMAIDRRRLQTAAIVTRVAIQVIGALLVLLVIFGPPNNLGTFLGLAGAGLTVALKDFIIGFLGWFVLMGNDGIRIGDLVEINGVTGEVVELGIFRTVLLETGSWSDAGHPTGRRVTFNNSFAIEGHYFNFSTTGQWLWDEVRVVVPRGRDPYPVAETLKTQVEAATAEYAHAAEEHWKGARRSPRFSSLTAAPTVNIKPIVEGIEITLQYITHMTERDRVRAELYRTAVPLLGEHPASGPEVAVPSAKS
jgi:small-conductance mechanosensitive channel